MTGGVGLGLGLRFFTMCMVCAIAFSVRSMIEGFETLKVLGKLNILVSLHPKFGCWDDTFGRDVMGYLTLEWFPAIMVLLMMHKSSGGTNSSTNNPDFSNSNNNGVVNRPRNMTNDDTVTAMESGDFPTMSSVSDQHGQQQSVFFDTKPKTGTLGVNRSFSANGGIPVPLATRTMMSQQSQQSANQRVMGASYGMLRSGSGGRVETTSLIGEKNVSNVSNNVAQSYGATVQIDDP